MITRRRALTAAAALPLASIASPIGGQAVSPGSFTERMVTLIESTTHDQAAAAFYLLMDIWVLRTEERVPRDMTTKEAIASGLLRTDLLRDFAAETIEHDLVEALLRSAA